MDDWVLYDTESPSASGVRGLATGYFFAAGGALLATVVQEGLGPAALTAPARGVRTDPRAPQRECCLYSNAVILGSSTLLLSYQNEPVSITFSTGMPSITRTAELTVFRPIPIGSWGVAPATAPDLMAPIWDAEPPKLGPQI